MSRRTRALLIVAVILAASLYIAVKQGRPLSRYHFTLAFGAVLGFCVSWVLDGKKWEF